MRNDTYIVYDCEDGIRGEFSTFEEAVKCAEGDISVAGGDGISEEYANGGLKILKVVSESYIANVQKKSDLFEGNETEEERQEIIDDEWPISDEFDEIWDVQMRPVSPDIWISVEDDLPKEKGFFEVVVAPSRDHLKFPEEHSRIMISKFYPDKDEAVHFYLNVRYLSAATRNLGERAQHWAISHEEGYVVTHWRRCPPMPEGENL